MDLSTPLPTSDGMNKTAKRRVMAAAGPPKYKKKTFQEKRQRQSGKNTQKPYISSSLGDMCRLMIRMACTENTLDMVDPPPLEFYDYWHKFQAPDPKVRQKLPYECVDTRKVSVPQLKMITSSFEMLAKMAHSSPSLDVVSSDSELRRRDYTHQLAPKLSDLWKGVKASLSGESFISSSTKVSQTQDSVALEGGWSDDDDDDPLLSDSDDDGVSVRGTATDDEGGATHSHAHPDAPIGTDQSKSRASTVMSIQSLEEKRRKEMGAVDASILRMAMEEAKAAYENVTHKKEKKDKIIDHFMEDLNDSFLIDAVSYGLLPDSAFTPDFDYFNEDPLYAELELEKEREEEEAQAVKDVN